MTPRGIRNNNPGNIRHGDKWKGLSENQSDPAFCVFIEPKWGIRALAVLLRNYKRLNGISTIYGIINRFAPPIENDTAAYISAVCEVVGCAEDVPLDLENEDILLPLIKAIIKHENGQQPYTDEQILEGIRC